jgi:RecA/RadA recombinase
LAEAFKQKHELPKETDPMASIFIANAKVCARSGPVSAHSRDIVVQSIEEQWDIIFTRLPRAMAEQTIRLVVIDSIAALLRVEFDADRMVER